MSTDSSLTREGKVTAHLESGSEGVGAPSAGGFGLPLRGRIVRYVSSERVCIPPGPRSDSASPVWPGPALAIALACGLLGPPCPSDGPNPGDPDADTDEATPVGIAMAFADPLTLDP